MKKYSIVLLIAVLAVSSVFAGITGYVDAKYQINFDKGTFGYTKPQDKLKASIVFDDQIGNKKGDGKVYVDAAASFQWNTSEKNKEDDGSRFAIDELGFFKLSLDKLMIVGHDWTLNLKEAEKLGNYAASTLDFHTWYRHDHLKGFGDMVKNDGDKWYSYTPSFVSNPDYLDLNPNVAYAVGDDSGDSIITDDIGDLSPVYTERDLGLLTFTVKDDYADYQKKVAYSVNDAYSYYNDDDEDAGMNGMTFNWKGYKFALAVNGFVGDWENDKRKQAQNYYFAAETKEFALENGLTMQGAVGFSYRDNDKTTTRSNFATGHKDKWTLGASLKASYETDKFYVDFATDQVINTHGAHTEGSEPDYAGAYSVKAKFAPVSAEVFFANEAVSKKGDDDDYKLFGGSYGDDDYYEDADGNSYYAGRTYNHDFISKEKKYYFSSQGLYKKNTIRDLLSFQVGFDFAELCDLPVSLKFQALDMVHETRIFNIFADTKLMDGDLSLSVYAKDILASYDDVTKDADYQMTSASSLGAWAYWDENGSKQKIGVDAKYNVNEALSVKAGMYMQLGKKEMGASAGATYKADLFVADASLETTFNYDDTKVGKSKMQAKFGVSSDKLVDGAVLSLKYESGNIFGTKANYDWFIGQEAGKVTAKCRVNF